MSKFNASGHPDQKPLPQFSSFPVARNGDKRGLIYVGDPVVGSSTDPQTGLQSQSLDRTSDSDT